MTHFPHNICISDLKFNSAWVPRIALWHHEEWLKNHEGLNGRDRSARVIQAKLREREASLARHMSDETLPTTFVAVHNSNPIGTVSLVYYKFAQDDETTEWLTNMFVLPEYRRCGIATALLEAALSYASALNLHRLLLYTSDQVAFYRKRNWRSINNGVVQGQAVEIMDYILPKNTTFLRASVGSL